MTEKGKSIKGAQQGGEKKHICNRCGRVPVPRRFDYCKTCQAVIRQNRL